MMRVEVKNIFVNLQGNSILKDVSVCLEAGETFVLMGPSGCGKSTLLRAINGIIPYKSGSIHLDFGDRKLSMNNKEDLFWARRNCMSFVFQSPALLHWRSVIDNVAYPLEITGINPEERRERAKKVLELVHLNEWSEHFPSSLSGGMQQRVGLARALVTDAPFLLLDEPFSALDPLIREELQDELLEIQRKLKKTLLFITHDLEEAIKVGDRIGILKEGELGLVGTFKELAQKVGVEGVNIEKTPMTFWDKEKNPLGVLGGHKIFHRFLNN